MNAQINAITLGVKDVSRARKFYGEGLGFPIKQDTPQWVAFGVGGAGMLGLYARDALAADAGVKAAGTGFPGFAFNHFVESKERVDAVLAEAMRAGGSVVKAAEQSQWGGYYGYFADPDGYLWKVVAS